MKKYVFIASLLITACSAEKTITPTVTLQPPAIASAPPLPLPTQEIASPTPKPTQYPDALEEQKVKEYLLTNNGCSLPCFWGIAPGNTSLEDAIEFFQPFGIAQYHGRSGQNIQNQYDVGLYVMSQLVLNSASIFEEDRTIVGIEVSGGGRPDEISTFWEIWAKYLVQEVIGGYGYPDRIWFDTYHNPEVPDPDRPIGYSLWFFYDEKDFLLVYSGITTKAPEYQVCLGNKSIEKDFGNLSPFLEMLIHTDLPLEDFAIERGIDQRVHFYSDKNVELPIDEFRRMIDNPDACFNTPFRLPAIILIKPTSSRGRSETYDANGNMTTRVEGGLTYTQVFDAENRLISVTVSGQITQFVYDGDGNLVKKIKPDGSKTICPSALLRSGYGGIYEVDKTSGGSDPLCPEFTLSLSQGTSPPNTD